MSPVTQALCVRKAMIVPMNVKSVESRIQEHKKFRRQSEIRVASGKKLILICIAIALALTWYRQGFWLIGLGLVALPTAVTLIEVWSRKKHQNAIAELSKNV